MIHDILREDAERIWQRVPPEKLRDKTFLILGSNGLIGTQLVVAVYVANQTLGLNARVIGISRNPPNDTLRGLADDARLVFHHQDLATDFQCNEKADFAFHGATYGQPRKFLEDPLGTIRLNTYLTEKLLEYCARHDTAMLFASSAFVYGQPGPEHIPTPETYNGNLSTTAPRAAYGESKRLGETICSIFRDRKKLDVTIARISETYGPGLSLNNDSRAIGDFLRQALTTKRVHMLDAGHQRRAWCYVSDCAAMLLNIMLQGQDFIYNVGGRNPVSIRDLAELICRLTGATLELPKEETGRLALGADHVELDLTRLMSEFKNCADLIPVQEGLRRVVQWNRDAALPALHSVAVP